MKRMYGDFTFIPEFDGPGPSPGGGKQKRSAKPGVPDLHTAPGPDPNSDGASTYFGKLNRKPRQNFRNNNQSAESGR